MTTEIPELKYDDNGLIPAIVQDIADNEIVMVGYMNAESLRMTLDKGLVTFWSRSRQEYWTKGETSGNVLKLHSIRSKFNVVERGTRNRGTEPSAVGAN